VTGKQPGTPVSHPVAKHSTLKACACGFEASVEYPALQEYSAVWPKK
jgi:hypothetical protein